MGVASQALLFLGWLKKANSRCAGLLLACSFRVLRSAMLMPLEKASVKKKLLLKCPKIKPAKSFVSLLRILAENEECVGRESNPGQRLGRHLCSPLYHRRLFHVVLFYLGGSFILFLKLNKKLSILLLCIFLFLNFSSLG